MSGNQDVELKGGMYTFMSLRVHTTDLERIDRQLAGKVQQAPGFFRDTPVVVDLTSVEADDDGSLDIPSVLEIVRRHHLHPIVASVRDKTSRVALTSGLPLIEPRARRGGSVESASSDEAAAPSLHRRAERSADAASNSSPDGSPSDATAAPTDDAEFDEREIEYVIKAPLLITRPVRSGQQIYARDTDLIVMGAVGPGAELVADNNIHVYGPLRGRALCGVSGNTATRIFCQSLEAELVSVAGNFRVLEQVPEALRGKPVQIWLDQDRLAIEPL